MAILDIENICQRSHIRRLTNITIAYYTLLNKVEKAVQIIEDILKDYVDMAPEFHR